MMHYMPEIFYHDRKALLSVDIHPVKKNGRYRIATVSVQNEVRIWDFNYDEQEDRIPICVNFVANLEGHNAAINQVKFSQNAEYDVLASGDVHGRISIWQLSDQPCTAPPAEDFPQNKENWVRVKVFNHESDVTALDFSHCGKYLASVSNDDSLQVHEALTGKRQFIVSYLRHFPNGVAYDPLGKYIMTMSTDRRMDLVCAKKGTRIRSFGVCELPEITFNQISLEAKTYKLFHDDQLTTFTRNCAFSPCGQLVVAPVGRLEVKSEDVYCTYVFKRWELEKDRPAMLLPSPKPTFCIRFCPIIFDLVPDSKVNYSGLPYRVIWLALTRESMIIYDSQHPHALALIENISYNNMSDAAWSRDGKNIVASSMEGYCHYLKLKINQLGVQVSQIENLPQCPESPHFVKKKVKKEKKPKEEEAPSTPTAAPAPVPSTPTTTKTLPGTPKTITPGGGLLRFLKRPNEGSPLSSRTQSSDQQHHTESGEPKAKKRINLITLK